MDARCQKDEDMRVLLLEGVGGCLVGKRRAVTYLDSITSPEAWIPRS